MSQWYTRKSNGDPTDPADYVPSGPTPPDCPGSGRICAIFAEDSNNGEPVLSEELRNEMITALSDPPHDTQNVLLRFAN